MSGGRAFVPRPFLFHVIDALRPTEPPARFSLEGVSSLLLGPGGARVQRTVAEPRLGVSDPYGSTRHAPLRRDGARWQLEDTSKNGTCVNGEPIGANFFRFRQLEATSDDLGDHIIGGDGLVTLLPSLQQVFRE